MLHLLVRRVLPALAAALLAVTLSPSVAPAADAPASITIAMQPGIGYANLIVMKQQGVLEKRFPQTKITWVTLSNGDAIRDGIIAHQIQIGSGAGGPFLVGWDRGIGYRLIGALNLANLWLVAKNPKYKTLKDFGPGTKIGMPTPDAIQGIVLRKAALEQLGNAHALDQNMVAIQHPLGVAALLNGQLDAHLTSPPFQQEEVDAGGHVILRSYDIFGRISFNSVFTTEAFANDNPIFIREFYAELSKATQFINKNPDAAAELLSRDTGGKVAASKFKKWITDPGIQYSTIPHGLLKTAAFMKDIGMLSKVPASIRDLELPMLQGVGD